MNHASDTMDRYETTGRSHGADRDAKKERQESGRYEATRPDLSDPVTS